jgi:hypothetical protein
MRHLALLALLPLAGCFFPTPLLTPEPLPGGQTRLDAAVSSPAYGLVPMVGANVRYGLGGGREVQARGDLFWPVASQPGVMGGGGVTQRVSLDEASGAAASINLSGSLALFPSDTYTQDDRRLLAGYGYLTGLVGTDRTYAGLRVFAGSQSDGDGSGVFGGPVLGVRFGSRAYLGIELGAYVSTGEGFWVSPAVTFGLQPDRRGSIPPAPGAPSVTPLPPEASGGG